MFFNRSPRIILQNVTLQGVQVEIPVADIKSNTSGPTVVITGGMDGDEYTGIRAAYDLINYYSTTPFAGRIIILPIMNIPGFYDGKSLNPQDYKFPKFTFPGNENGSATEQLIYWFNTTFLKDADAWLDLHSGAITEELQPFVWGFETSNKKLNTLTKNILSALDSKIIIYEKARFLLKADTLAAKGCLYMVYERGEKGEQNIAEIGKVVEWVKKTVEVMNITDLEDKKIEAYKSVQIYNAPFDGMWIPAVNAGSVKKGQIGGVLQTLNKSKSQEFKFKESGEILWMKSALFARKGDELLVTASDKTKV